MKHLTIIVPAHNEEKRIGCMLEAYGTYFSRLNKKRETVTKLIVVINNTKDSTENVVLGYEKKFSFISHINFVQGGKGFAIIEGFKEALKRGCDCIGYVDADLATSPKAFFDLYAHLANADGIIASRYIPGAKVNPRQSMGRIISSRAYNFFLRVIFFMPYRDTQCGAKVFTSTSIEKILACLSLSQWAFDIDLLYQLRRHGYSVIEIPTEWSDKEYSKLNLKKAAPSMLLAVMRLRIINSPFRKLVGLYERLFYSKVADVKNSSILTSLN